MKSETWLNFKICKVKFRKILKTNKQSMLNHWKSNLNMSKFSNAGRLAMIFFQSNNSNERYNSKQTFKTIFDV